MKKKKTCAGQTRDRQNRPCQKEVSLLEESPQKGFRHHCSKVLLMTASYQLFSVFLCTGGVEAAPAGPGQTYSRPEGALSQLASSTPSSENGQRLPGLYVGCIGCTTGPDNVPCAGTSCTCTGCVGCTRSCIGGCTSGCTGCVSSCIGATITQSTRAQELARQADGFYNGARYREALDLYLEAKRTWPNWDGDQRIANCRSMILRQEANDLNEQGVANYNRKNWDKAVQLFEEALKKWPDNQTFRTNLTNATTERDNARAKDKMHSAINDFVITKPPTSPSSGGLTIMSSEEQRPAGVRNPQIQRLMKEADNIKVPPPLRRGDSPVEISDFVAADRTSKNIFFGTEAGIAAAEVGLTLAGKSMTLGPRIIFATGRTFIAMENGADLYLVKQDSVYKEALRYLKDRQTAPVFTAAVRALREKKPLPTGVSQEMLRAAQAIIDPRLGSSGRRIAWGAMWSPEARAAGISRACIELGAELMGHGITGTVRSMTAARDPAFKAAASNLASAEALLKKASSPAEKQALEEVVRKSNNVLVRSYEATAIGMGTIAAIKIKEEEAEFRHR